MKFYTKEVEDNYPYAPIESVYGDWATRADAEQMEQERDELKRKSEELCLAYGRVLMEFNDAKRDAVEMAKLVQKRIIEIHHERDWELVFSIPDYRKAQSIIDRYDGGK